MMRLTEVRPTAGPTWTGTPNCFLAKNSSEVGNPLECHSRKMGLRRTRRGLKLRTPAWNSSWRNSTGVSYVGLVLAATCLFQNVLADAVPSLYSSATPDRGSSKLNLIHDIRPNNSSQLLPAIVSADVDQSQVQAPRFITQPTASAASMASEGQNKILQCKAAGVPQPDIRWLKDGQYLGEFTTEYFYRIQAIKRQDAGEYQCIARNSVGAIFSEKAKVTVAYMSPISPKANDTTPRRQGEAAILRLPPISSQPLPTVQWMSREGPLFGIKYATTLDHALVILATEPKDSKTYWAQITNEQLGQDERSGSFTLQVSSINNADDDIAPQMIEPPKDIDTVKGTKLVTLECIANARPLEQLQTLWRKDGRPIHRSGVSYTIHDLWNRTLNLQNIEELHAGMYECEVRLGSNKKTAIKAAANITVLEGPQIVKGPPLEVEMEYGKNVDLECTSSGSPSPTVTWYRNTIALGADLNSRFSIKEDGTLNINDLRMSDSGMFQCVVSNSMGEITAYSWLRVKTSKPVIKNPPSNATVYDGKDVQLICEADGAPKPTVTWMHGDERISSAGRIQVLDSGTLLIAAAQPHDEGSYVCIQTNSEGKASATAHLSVRVRTQIAQPPVDTKIILGNTASLQCRVSHDPNVHYNLTWLFKNEPIVTSPNGRIQMKADGSLEIGEARNNDIGEYRCIVESPGGNDTRSASLDVVELPYPPTGVHAKLVPGVGIVGSVSKKVNISWTPGFHGNSPIINYIVQKRIMANKAEPSEPYTEWQQAISNVSSDQRWVIINGLKPALSYQFRVISVNGVGEGQPSDPSELLTLPQEPPSGPPLNVVGSPRSSTSIIVQWQPPDLEDRNGELRGYIIRYRLASYQQNAFYTRNITMEAQRSYAIEDLITWREYEIQIAAFNDKGIGVYSPGIKVRTKEGVPLAAPTNVSVEALTSTSVRVTWTPPDPQLINGVNQGYKLQAWKGDPNMLPKPYRTAIALPSPFDPLAKQSANLTDLKKFEEYNITVLCFTHPGEGKRSSPSYVRTKQDVPDIVSNFTIDDVKDRSVHVHWAPPKHTNGILLGYILRFRIRDEPNSEIQRNLSISTLNLLVDNLRPTTYYTFEIFAFTVIGAGSSRASTILSGIPPVLPHAPTKLAVSNIEAFSVLLQFTPGFDGNASVSRWTIEAQVGRNITWRMVYEATVPDGQQAFIVRNLIPFMEYRLRLMANNIVGASPPSEPSRPFQTLQAAPRNPPQSVTVRAMGPTSIRVRWTPLPQIDWYGVPRGYNISYRRSVMGGPPPPLQSVLLENHNANFYVIEELDEFEEYEVTVEAYNDVGSSQASPNVIERTRESVPSAGPGDVQANATSSTTIVVKWGEVPDADCNGIIEGYKVYYGAKSVPTQYQTIASNSTFTTTLTRLKKYVMYNIQVLAYTRMGDGILSASPVQVRTLEDVPGPPSNVSFPDVSQTMARVVWDLPEEPNGVITDYRVTYQLNGTDSLLLNETFQPTERTYRATGLDSEKYYVFTVTAKTSVGWGRTVSVLVFTTSNRETPQPPSEPRISQSQILSDQITFTWTPGRDGFAPLRFYMIQQAEEDELWQTVPECVDPSVTFYTARQLKPFSKYKFRIEATNDIGPSGWSPESNYTRTLPAAPGKAPTDVLVVPITTTSVKVTWKALVTDNWNGDEKTGGYRIEYHQTGEFVANFPKEEIRNPKAANIILRDLSRDKTYDVVVIAFNSQGDGPKTNPVTVYVGEAVPTGEPLEVKARTLSSTAIQLIWRPPLENHQNGELQGYKIYYLPSGEPREKEEMEVVPPASSSLELLDLLKFTLYRIQILAFNPAGDGPRSAPLEVRTSEDLPGPPSNLQFRDITMTSLKVMWDPPEQPNGNIRGYIVTYETLLPNENFSKQVRQRVNVTHLSVHNLEEQGTYTFTVMAQTLDYGPPVIGNVTTGPQLGSPEPPVNLALTSTVSSVTLHWENSPLGNGHVTGYVIECLKQGEERWQEVTRTTNGVVAEYTVSYQNLQPSTNYRFRLFAVNANGISSPTESTDWIVTPEKYVQDYSMLKRTPFYREVWFLVTVAASSMVVIILVVAVLCVKSKSYKYKRRTSRSSTQSLTMQSSVTEEVHKSMPEVDKMSMDDGGFATFELRQSRRGTLRKSTLTRKGFKGLNGAVIAKSPPRPSPRNVAYSDEEDLKGYGYDDNCDDSSLTEKPSEVSSSESQASESDVESEKSDPHSFVNHYANVNDTLRQSWSRQRPAKAYSSYTDSEPEGSIAVSLNAGHIIMNNMAGSRAPLPGFSSFV